MPARTLTVRLTVVGGEIVYDGRGDTATVVPGGGVG